jgi:hypothetical protein
LIAIFPSLLRLSQQGSTLCCQAIGCFHQMGFTLEPDHRADSEAIIFEACCVRRACAAMEFVVTILTDQLDFDLQCRSRILHDREVRS